MHVRHLLLTLITLCLPATQLSKRVGATLSNNTDTTQPAAGWKASAIRCLKNTPLPTPYQSAAALAAAAVVFVYLFRRELLLASAEKGYLLPVKLLITCGVDVNSYFRKLGDSALFRAATQGHPAVVAYLLTIKSVEKNGFWDKRKQGLHRVPLLEACKKKHLRVIEVLLENKAVNKNLTIFYKINRVRYTPLMFCCLCANKKNPNDPKKTPPFKDMALLFIKHMTEQEINFFIQEEKKTALDYATKNGDKDILNALKKKNAKKYAELPI